MIYNYDIVYTYMYAARHSKTYNPSIACMHALVVCQLRDQPTHQDLTHKYTACMHIYLYYHACIGHGPFSHMFEYGVYEQLKCEEPDNDKLPEKWKVL